MPPFSFIGKFIGRTTSEAAGFGVGGALTQPLVPPLQGLSNETWKRHPNRPLDVDVAAEIVAEDVKMLDWGIAEAELTGFDAERLYATVNAVRNAPGVPQLLTLWRRKLIKADAFVHGLRKARLEEQWDKPLQALFDERLAPSDVANAIQQAFIPGDGILPAPDDTGPPFTIPVETVNIDPQDEAQAHGIDPDRLRVLAQLAGLPPGPMELLDMWNRKLIDENAVNAGIREGHIKTKWRGPLKALRNPILSGAEYANLRLKGWLTRDEAKAGGALSGYSETQMDQLWQGMGRPATTHQAFIGARRGGSYDGPTGDVPDYFKKAVIQSNLRPEWTNLLWAQRHTYPSAFVLRALTQGGDITQAQAEDILKFIGWPETLAVSVAKRWAEKIGGGVKALTASTLLAEHEGGYMDTGTFTARLRALGYSAAEAALYVELGEARKVASARNATLTTIRQRYVSHQLSRDEMLTQLGKTDAAQEAKDRIVVEWDNAREATRVQLTAAQVKKAYAKNQITRTEAEDLLAARGWRALDLQRYLDQ